MQLGQREHLSLAEATKFRIQNRVGVQERFVAGNLGQLFIIDAAGRVKEMRMNFLGGKRAEFPFMVDGNSLFAAHNKKVVDLLKGPWRLGCLVTTPSSVPGTSKYQRELVMSAVKVANELGPPDLFITFTGNPEWPEIKRACEQRKCTWADLPDFVNRVFKRKWEMALDMCVGKQRKLSSLGGKHIRDPGIFGKCNWFTYSTEFQQRGMPHCHLLLSLETPITSAEQIDKIISAQVPDLPTDENDPEYADVSVNTFFT